MAALLPLAGPGDADAAVWLAAAAGRPAVLEALLASGAAPGAARDGVTAVAAAEKNGHAECVALLRRPSGGGGAAEQKGAT